MMFLTDKLTEEGFGETWRNGSIRMSFSMFNVVAVGCYNWKFLNMLLGGCIQWGRSTYLVNELIEKINNGELDKSLLDQVRFDINELGYMTVWIDCAVSRLSAEEDEAFDYHTYKLEGKFVKEPVVELFNKCMVQDTVVKNVNHIFGKINMYLDKADSIEIDGILSTYPVITY